MKITLHDPPEGFEAEAEIRPRKYGEIYLDLDSHYLPYAVLGETETKYPYIVLTPKKKKYWRLDPVATFEEATKSRPKCYGYAMRESDGLFSFWDHTASTSLQWLKLTEHEE